VRARAGLGDEVLVLRDEEGLHFVLDILEKAAEGREDRILLQDGTTVSAESDGDDERLRITAANGDLIFEYDAGKRRAHVRSAEGITFDAGRGDLNLQAAGKLKLSAGSDIELSTRAGMTLESGSAGAGRTAISLRPRAMELGSPRLRMRAEQAELTSAHTTLTSRRLRITAAAARVVVQRLESLFDDVVQRATTIYQHVKDSIHTRAGRVRTVADNSIHVSSEHYVCRGRADIKLKSDKIHLA
jgi:hypothetical protein